MGSPGLIVSMGSTGLLGSMFIYYHGFDRFNC